jgi:hypothetical protein
MGAVVEVPGELRLAVSELRKIKDKKEALKEQLTELGKEEESFEKIIIEQMQVLGTDSMRFEDATVSIKPEVFYSISDWSRMAKFVLDLGRVDLFQRRVSKEAVLDIKEKTGQVPPGVTEGERMRLNFRRSKV